MNEFLLDMRGVAYDYAIGSHMTVCALRDVTLSVRRGEILGLIGESGSGKSTLARCAAGLLRPTSGTVRICGLAATGERSTLRVLAMRRQLIFQEAGASLNGRMTVAQLIAEPMKLCGVSLAHGSLRAEVTRQLARVGLDAAFLNLRPEAMSGGQRQRVAIARALAAEPPLLVADEPTASLDVSVQAQVLNLFRERREKGAGMLLVSHDLPVVRYLCDRVGVLHDGKLVEMGSTEAVFERPKHAYTRALLVAAPACFSRK